MPDTPNDGHLAATARNRAAILAFEAMWGVALPFVYYTTVLPGFLRSLDVPNVWIGLVPAVHNGVLAMVQPLSAYLVREDASRLRKMRGFYLVSAAAYTLLAVFVLQTPQTAITALLAALAAEVLFGVFTGLGDPQYMAVVVNAVAPSQRGRFFGLRAVWLGLGGIAGGGFTEWVLKSARTPFNFGWSFLAGGLLMFASNLTMAFYRDHPNPPQAPQADLRGYLRDRIAGPAREPSFRRYLVAVVCFSLAACAFPFLGLLVKERLRETDQILGLLGSVFMAANMTQSWLLGALCDRWGSRRGLALALLVYVIGILGCLTLHDRTLLLGSYYLASIWLPGQMIAATDLALRLTKNAPASEVTATMMLAMAPARIVGPLLVGAALDLYGYPLPVLLCSLFGLLGIGALWAGSETRSRRTKASV